jgi:glycerol-3-phosphate dehydrogenase
MDLPPSINRTNLLQLTQSESFDVVVIGGGITGAGIAWDASLRGLKVLLLEQNDFASGTSSKSTKLIHGGLRYLKQLKFRQVYEVGRERAIVHKIGRFLVRSEKMLLPIYQHGSLNKWSAGLALAIYDFLAGVEFSDSFKYFNAKDTSIMEPLLPHTRLKGSFLYAEYQTDDQRLTWSLIQSAMEKGAICLNYAKVIKFNTDTSLKLCSLDFKDQLTGHVSQINAPFFINAGGPWVMDIIDFDPFPPKKELLLSKGTHIVIPFSKLPLKQALYFDDAEKKRMIFAIPREETTYIGTTDLIFDGNKDRIVSSIDEIDYLLHTIQVMFPTSPISVRDILTSWVGVRPLIKEKGKDSTEVSRKDEIFISKSGLLSIAGGKLTGFRKMAQKVLDKGLALNKDRFKKFKQKCQTKTAFLAGNSFSTEMELADYLTELTGRWMHLGLDPQLVESYLKRYGDRITHLLSYLKEGEKYQIEDLIVAEIKYGIHHEMIQFPVDFLQRQTGMIWFNKTLCLQHKEVILSIFSSEFCWNNDKLNLESSKFDALLQSVLDFK